MLKKFFSGLILFIAAVVGGAKAYIDYQLEHELAHILSQYFPQNRIHYQHASLSLLGAITLKNVVVETEQLPNLQIENVTLHQVYRFYNPEQWLDSIKINFYNLIIPISEIATEMPMLIKALGYQDYYVTTHDLYQLGYGQLHMDMALDLQRHDAQFELHTNIDGYDFGTLQLNLQGDHFTSWQNGLHSRLNHANVQYVNTEFMDKILLFLAQRQNMPLVALKQRLTSKLTQDLQQSGINLPTNVLVALQTFIQTPHYLMITVAPQPPIIFEQLNQLPPQSLIERLKLQITATKQRI